MTNDFILILCGLAGVLFHCLLKLQGLLTDARVANVEFKPIRDYWIRDAVGICLSLLSVGIWHLVFHEVQSKYAPITGWTKTSFVGMGLLGSYVIQLVSSSAKRRLRQIVDKKTNDLEGPGTKTPLKDKS